MEEVLALTPAPEDSSPLPTQAQWQGADREERGSCWWWSCCCAGHTVPPKVGLWGAHWTVPLPGICREDTSVTLRLEYSPQRDYSCHHHCENFWKVLQDAPGLAQATMAQNQIKGVSAAEKARVPFAGHTLVSSYPRCAQGGTVSEVAENDIQSLPVSLARGQ